MKLCSLALALVACGASRPAPPANEAPAGRTPSGAIVALELAGDRIARVGNAESTAWLWPPIVDSHVHLAYWPVTDRIAEAGIAAAVDLAAPERTLATKAPIHVIAAGPMLTRTPGSVLWLMDGPMPLQQNLQREAAARGVAPERLVFARERPKPEHLARHQLADLFLDTPLCNAHTTASDALWAGVPLLTCPGTTFATRVAASLLTTLGMPELIAADLPAYEQTALRLASNPGELGGLREQLALRRLSSPLFDTPRFVHALEQTYRELDNCTPRGK